MDKLNKVLCEVFRLKENELDMGISMTDLVQWDSLTHMDLVTSLEDEFSIQFSMDEIMNMKNIQAIKEVIELKLR